MTVASYAAAQLIRLLPRTRISGVLGRASELTLPPAVSRAVLGAYSRAYDVNLDEAQKADGFTSFDEFFTRELRPGVRPIADDVAVSPADGRIQSRGGIDENSRIYVKGSPYSVAELIDATADAERYRGGSFAVVYLSPRDYHRVHSPVAGQIVEVRGTPGDLFPVNSIGERHVPGLFVKNNRVSIVIDTEAIGRVTVVMVGAMVVGRISVSVIPEPAVPPGTHRLDEPVSVSKGEEIGIFHLGSTAVVLFEDAVRLVRPTGPVEYGQPLARVV